MTEAQSIGELWRELLEVDRRREIISGVLPAGVGFLYGPSTVGKTGIAVRTAIAIAGGLRWGGLSVTKGAVLYVAGEARRSVAQRLCATIEHLRLSANDTPIWVMPCPPKGLIDRDSMVKIRDQAKKFLRDTDIALALIVIDTLSTCFGDAKEDDSNAASKAVTNMAALHETFDCAVMAIHHPGKGENRGMRGSGVFFNNVDFVLSVVRKGSTSILTVEKYKDGAAGARFAFDIASRDLAVAGGDISVQVIENINAWTEADKATKEEAKAKRDLTDRAVVMQLFREINVDGSARIKALQRACYDQWKSKPSPAAQRQAFSAARKQLEKSGDLVFDDRSDTVSVSVSKKPPHKWPDINPPDSVSVSVSTTPSRGGVHERAYRSSEAPAQEPDGDSATSPGQDPVGRPNGLPRGAGGEAPAERVAGAPDKSLTIPTPVQPPASAEEAQNRLTAMNKRGRPSCDSSDDGDARTGTDG